MSPRSIKRLRSERTLSTFYHGHSITPFKLHDACDIDLRFLLGVCNSRVTSWFAGLTLSNFGKETFPKLNPQDVKALPIPRIDLKQSDHTAAHDSLVRKVDAMLKAKKQLRKGKTDRDKTYYKNKCTALDRQIDGLVYELYGLTEKEIQIVEQQEVVSQVVTAT